jgi:tetratricopeptide (TPR) repeat protein
MMGEFERAVPHAEHGVRLAREIQNPFAESSAYHFRGCVRDQRGEWSLAIADYEEGRAIADRAGDLFRIHLIKSWEGRAHALNGDPVRGRTLLEESSALAEQIGTKFGLPGLKAWLADCLFRLGELDAARSFCEESIRLGEDSADRYMLALAHRTLGEILSRLERSRPQKAEGAFLEAIRLQQEIRARPELARSYMSYASSLKGNGEQEEATEYLAKAQGMFQAMGMAWDLAQSEQVLLKLQA